MTNNVFFSPKGVQQSGTLSMRQIPMHPMTELMIRIAQRMG